MNTLSTQHLWQMIKIKYLHKTRRKISQDYIYNYYQGKLAFGLLLFEFEDADKESDGDRLLNVYKFALLIYKCYGHHKYAYVILFIW